tara:strand:+ start:386 stop:904 length:519 start_codon:yes stop_codon:yes gene_type:complete
MLDKSTFLNLLKKHDIKFDLYEHPPLHTVEESKKMRGKIQGAHTKNLFLKNKKNQFFLFSCIESTEVDLKELKKNLCLGNISFAKDKYLDEILNVKPGSVTPFGLLNDKMNIINFFLDAKILNHETVNFHPLTNTSTINIKTQDFLSFMKNNNKKIKILNFKTYIINNERYN